MKNRFYILMIGCLLWIGYSTCRGQSVRLGVDIFVSEVHAQYAGMRIGLITNQTGMTSSMESTVDALYRLGDPVLVKLFGPEHGIRGDAHGGDEISDVIDRKTGLPVYSLYGGTRKPTESMLEGVDVLVYDIQDIGNRTYTYIYTMALAMQSAEEKGIPFVVFDRPIPMDGNLVDGNILDPKFSSFIGLYPIPYVYGMTPGELAGFFNQEFHINADLRVIRMEFYDHGMNYEDTGLIWIPTSPHIPRAETAYHCAATGCIGELHTVCVGIGYTLPFELIGADWIDGDDLAENLNSRRLPGVFFRPVFFRPFYHEFEGVSCSGVQILIQDSKIFHPFTTQVHILAALQELYPESGFLTNIQKKSRIATFDRAAGTDLLRQKVLARKSAELILKSFRKDLEKFKRKRKEYLLYE